LTKNGALESFSAGCYTVQTVSLPSIAGGLALELKRIIQHQWDIRKEKGILFPYVFLS
jgi:hypothetical protein